MMTVKVHRPLHILLAVDGSKNALAAAELVRDLPLPSESRITIVAVLTVRHTTSRANILAALDEASHIFSGKDLIITTGLLHGHPAQEIAHHAEEINPDMIVVGATGLRSTMGILLGGVAQQLVEYSHWPVLIVRMPYQGIKRVLLVTDGSEYSDKTITCLCGKEDCPPFPFPTTAELSVMHVLPPIPIHEAEDLAIYSLEEEKIGKELLEKTTTTLKQAGIKAASALTRGDAATEIIQHARDHQTDLIIAGSRGLSEIQGWILGSVSRKLVHYAPCSVLVVRGPGERVERK